VRVGIAHRRPPCSTVEFIIIDGLARITGLRGGTEALH